MDRKDPEWLAQLRQEASPHFEIVSERHVTDGISYYFVTLATQDSDEVIQVIGLLDIDAVTVMFGPFTFDYVNVRDLPELCAQLANGQYEERKGRLLQRRIELVVHTRSATYSAAR